MIREPIPDDPKQQLESIKDLSIYERARRVILARVSFMCLEIVQRRRRFGCNLSLQGLFTNGWSLTYGISMKLTMVVELIGRVCSELLFGAYGRIGIYVFQDLTWSSNEVINTSLCWAKQYGSMSASGGIRTSRANPGPLIKDGWVFLNTNGSVRSDERYAAAGGLLCDHEGNLIVGFSSYLGSCEVIDAEL
ncbi:hypothetical protein J1N35_031437 [Gossypium stocksii]|uniref:RNase H type-1 domain-containing protein n=1 Tax=Gossypium stocksii TaxID=47602 RepID=A0A9D3V139_9ROSI|nr:hypothetical protein J1N35_031437 [Gossypium stocksii]